MKKSKDECADEAKRFTDSQRLSSIYNNIYIQGFKEGIEAYLINNEINNVRIEITGAGYEAIKKSELFFSIHYSIDGMLTMFPLFIDVIAENKEDAIKWIKAKHPEYIIHNF